MDYTLDEALNNLWDRTRRALEDAQRNARLVERLEEETKKLKELTNSIHEKRMQDEKELEEIRLRMEILEREEQEQKKAKMQQEEEKRRKRRLEEEDDDALSALMLKQYGKVKIYTDSGDFYWGYHYPPQPSSEPDKKKETSKEKKKARTMPTEAESKEDQKPLSPTSPAFSDISEITETSVASWHNSDEESVLRLANYPIDHPDKCPGPIAPVEERIESAIYEILEDRKFFRKIGCLQQ